MRQFRFVRKPLVVLKSCRAPSTSFTRSSLLRFGMALRRSRTYATPSFCKRASLNTPMIRRSVGLSLSSRLHFSNAPTTEATDSPSSKKGSSCGFFSGKSIASRSRQSQHWRFSSSAEDRHGTKRQLTATNPRSISAAIIVEGRLFQQCRCTAFLLQVNAVVPNGVPSRGGWREPTAPRLNGKPARQCHRCLAVNPRRSGRLSADSHAARAASSLCCGPEVGRMACDGGAARKESKPVGERQCSAERKTIRTIRCEPCDSEAANALHW